MKDIRSMIGHNEYARFGDWVMFGGLVYKRGKANYGLNMERCRKFLTNSEKVQTVVWKDPMTKEIIPSEWKYAKDVPGLLKFIDNLGMFEVNYSQAELKL
jgi:hypothetical protein